MGREGVGRSGRRKQVKLKGLVGVLEGCWKAEGRPLDGRGAGSVGRV